MTLSNQSYASCSAMGVMSGLPKTSAREFPANRGGDRAPRAAP